MNDDRVAFTDSVKRSGLALNTVAQSSPLIVGYLASFISAPLILHGIGLRGFGTWALTGALAQYAALLDFGVGPSLTRFVALYDVEDRADLIGEVLASGIFTSTLISITLGVGSVFAAAPIAHTLHTVTPGGARIMLLSATCMFTCSNYVNVLFSHKIGLRQMVVPNMVATGGAVVNFAFSVTAALVFRNVVVYAVANAAASATALLMAIAYSCFLANPRFLVKLPSPKTVRELTTFSFKSQMQTAASLVNTQTDKIVIALFIGPAAAGAYELANRIAFAAQAVGVYSVSAMVPTLTADGRRQSLDVIRETYRRWTQRSTAISAPILMLTAALAPLILAAWLGKGPHDSGLVLCVLSLSYVLISTTGVGYTLAFAFGAPGLPAKSAIAAAVGNIILTASLAPIFGIWGVLAGTAVAISAGALYQVFLVQRRFEMPFSVYWKAVLPPLRISALLALPLAALALACSALGRWEKAGVVVLACGLYLVAYALLADRAGLLPDALARRVPHRAPKVNAKPDILD